MNKKMFHALTGVVLSTTMMSTYTVPTLAEEAVEAPVQQVPIENAQQFIDTYFTIFNEDGSTTLIQSVDENNMATILAAKATFDACPFEMQEEIVANLSASGVDFNAMVNQAMSLQAPVEPVQPEQPAEQAQPEQQPTEQPVEQPVEQPEQQQPQDVQEEAQPEVQEQPTEQEAVLEVQEVQEEVQEQPVMLFSVLAQPEPIEVLEEPQVQPVLEEVTPVLEQAIDNQMNAQEEVPSVLEVVQQPQALAQVLNDTTSEDDDTTTFITNYVSNSNGTVYASANDTNYQHILAGVSTWNQMTTKEKAKVNAVLTRESKKTYQEFLKEAQTVQVQQTGTPVTYVNGRIATGLQNNTMPAILGLAAAIVLGIVAILGLKKKK